jgi:hypothetical protein
MKCLTCHRASKPLFTSYFCEWCDGEVDTIVDRGFIVYIPEDLAAGSSTFIFRCQSGAETWRAIKNLEKYPVREVYTPCKIRWMMSKGTMKAVELADRVFEIYPDHRFPYAENRAYLNLPKHGPK